MSSRTDWLTDTAKKEADKMKKRSGSLKMIMSAGVMCLRDCTPEKREYYMAIASGEELPVPEPLDEVIRRIVEQAVAATIAALKKPPGKRPK